MLERVSCLKCLQLRVWYNFPSSACTPSQGWGEHSCCSLPLSPLLWIEVPQTEPCCRLGSPGWRRPAGSTCVGSERGSRTGLNCMPGTMLSSAVPQLLRRGLAHTPVSSGPSGPSVWIPHPLPSVASGLHLSSAEGETETASAEVSADAAATRALRAGEASLPVGDLGSTPEHPCSPCCCI